MRPREVLKLLWDITAACQAAASFVGDKTAAEYAADEVVRSAVERKLSIVGEALRQALRADPTLAARIAHWRRIIALRNRLIHGYADIDDEVVWAIVHDDVPPLHREVAALLAEASGTEE